MNVNTRYGISVLELLGDEYAQQILRAVSEGQMSANALHDVCDASLATVYRRIDTLVDHGLLREQVELDSDGNHCHVYKTNFESIDVQLTDGDFEVHVRPGDQTADRLTEMWDGMRRKE